MSTDYTSFLAARVLNDGKLITYRLLSRELKIHVNKAKEYLAEFHESENKKQKGACHATYIVTGIPKPLVSIQPKVDKDQDTYMESSPAPGATQNDEEEIVKVTTVIMVAEEQLEEIKESLQEVISIHVYSVEPAPLKDLLGAADASLDLYSRFPSTDSVERSKLYGSTLNKHVKRREGAAPPPPPQSTKSSAYVVPVKKEPAPTPSAPTPSISKERKEAKDFFGSMKAKETPKPTQASGPSSSAKAKVPLKRGQSDLMSSFSNAQPKKAKQPEKEKTPPPDFMDVDDDEPEDEPVDEEAKAAEVAKQEELRKKRAKDEEALRRMMDDDEEDDEPPPTKPTQDSASPEATAASPTEEEPGPATPTPTPSTSAPGRRKAKRKVTKKVRSKDENGYIVTREVTEWEEYSEDDVPAPVKPAAKPNAFSAMKQAPSSQKSKKATGDGAPKRDIASFFQKK
ncbi:hypothetical protein TWF694_001272 [Orbilia ellipsospora]|uniref:DNA polymerase delta subunit 3 n=1 Tax=Orbilia ellipsospora TaxID=2528407 RepID=A0AAV9XR66_9PEZI